MYVLASPWQPSATTNFTKGQSACRCTSLILLTWGVTPIQSTAAVAAHNWFTEPLSLAAEPLSLDSESLSLAAEPVLTSEEFITVFDQLYLAYNTINALLIGPKLRFRQSVSNDNIVLTTL